MTKQQINNGAKGIEYALMVVFGFLFSFAWKGIREFKIKDILQWLWGAIAIWMLALTIASLEISPFFPALFGSLLIALSLTGLSFNLKNIRFQKGLDLAGLKNIHGQKAKVLRVIELDDYRTEILVQAVGVGIDEFSAKKGRLESAFSQSVESINPSKDRKLSIIRICKRRLPMKMAYSDTEGVAKGAYSFAIGESLSGGFLSSNIRELPHLLIGGTTGGGKSNFFKTTLLGLLKSSPHLQMYLIDLKRGVEVKEFADLPNVQVAKNETDAVKILSVLKEEMDRRYEYLEREGYKNIDPVRDKKDLIVLGTDEASVLFGQVKSNRKKKELILQARDLTDELAKLARASGIHLILATQKPIKESIDTKTLENLPARMSFKMSTHAGSNSMLGNAKAYALPDIKGRGIWKDGNKFLEVQTPFVSDEELEQEISEIKGRYQDDKFKNFSPMLTWGDGSNEEANALNESTQKAK